MMETVKLNYFPAKHGMNKHCRPRITLHRENLDCERHCNFVTGECAQGDNDANRTSANESRTLDCLRLRPTVSSKGAHELLHLATSKVETCRVIAPLPIAQSIVDQVTALAVKDGI